MHSSLYMSVYIHTTWKPVRHMTYRHLSSYLQVLDSRFLDLQSTWLVDDLLIDNLCV
jgi:hypothetical protein